MIGRKIETVWGRRAGEVVRWEPLGASLTDALVRFGDGSECWYGSNDLRPTDGKGPLPSRANAREQARQESIRSLEAIRARHVQDFNKPWPGLDFGKAHVGQAIDGALADLKGKGSK